MGLFESYTPSRQSQGDLRGKSTWFMRPTKSKCSQKVWRTLNPWICQSNKTIFPELKYFNRILPSKFIQRIFVSFAPHKSKYFWSTKKWRASFKATHFEFLKEIKKNPLHLIFSWNPENEEISFFDNLMQFYGNTYVCIKKLAFFTVWIAHSNL